MSDAAATGLPFRCRLGWHDADPRALWNEGYYFTTCRRCRRDLIRTAYSSWQVPKGVRIVWSVGRPDLLESVSIATEADAEPPAAPEPVAPPPPPSAPTYVPDFMEDAAIDTSWRRHIPPPTSEAEQEPHVAAPASPPRRKGESAQRVPQPGVTFEGPNLARPRMRHAALALAAFVLIAVVTAVFAQDDEAGAAGPPSPALGGTRFVSSDTGCREGPSLQGANAGYLIRGDAVRLRASRGDWAAIAYADQQCWVPLTLLSAEPVS